MIPEFITVAQKITDGHELQDLDKKTIGRDKSATHVREFRELRHRINSLTDKQIEILAEGNIDEQKQITHLALCKTYAIYKDFVTDVLAEKVLVFDFKITELDYNSFISKKMIEHPELENLATTTQKKVKQVIYRMLEQVDMIDSVSNSTILIPNVEPRVEASIVEENPKLLTCFLYADDRITSIA
jgi:hypothetical protein